ncbi:MAG: hypothetical protein CMP11_06865 [Zetaproteobacteria bacterium]|nr:hypothetical protein [Pseudobdellovibrionaceae bacterium]|tara:strand:+ start:268 stop:1572 length:1305 start_codon:yes stop_codon:yes gene_type:complete
MKVLKDKIIAIYFILKSIFFELKDLDLQKEAGAMAYITLLSIVPSLAVSFSIMTVIGSLTNSNETFVEYVKSIVLQSLTQNSGEEVSQLIERFISSLNYAHIGISGLLGTFVTIIILLQYIEITLNKIWRLKKKRNPFVRFMNFWTFITIGAFLGSVIFSLFSLAKVQTEYTIIRFLFEKFNLYIQLFYTLFFIYPIYKYFPNTYVSNKAAFFGSIFSSLLFFILTKTFGLYIQFATSYKSIYGILAGLPIFLLWLYLCWVILLLGALLTWIQDHKDEGRNFLNENFSENKMIVEPRLQTLLPLLVLIVIYKEFSKGNIRSLTGEKLCSLLGIKRNLIIAAVKNLEERGYIILVKNNSKNHPIPFYLNAFLPSKPMKEVQLKHLVNNLAPKIDFWLPNSVSVKSQEYVSLLIKIIKESEVSHIEENNTLDKIIN